MRKIYSLIVLSLFAGHICSQTYCLENDITHAYLNDFSYDTIPDYNVSYVLYYDSLYKIGPRDYRLDAPKPVRLSWAHEPGAEAQRIEVSLRSDYDSAYVYSVHADSAAYDVYNLIPGKTYYYRVVSTIGESETTVGSGTFATSGLLRMIYAEGTWNVRDAGGWISGLTGQPIAYGKIFRGAQLKAKGKDSILLSKEGIEALRMIGIKAELDLRSNDQVPSSVSALNGSNYAVDFRIIPEAVNARMYNFQKNDATIRELQWIINELKQNKPVYYHCQNGADRTGTLGFLIGALLGMSEGDLAKDYELTTFCEATAAAYDPTEVGFARLRNYTGKMGSPLGSSEDNKEYMFAELANTMKSVPPTDGTYQQKIYNFFRTGVDGTKISPADLSWFIMEMTGYPILGGMDIDADSLILASGDTHQIVATPFPTGAEYTAITYESTNTSIATVTSGGLVRAVGGGEAFIIVDVDGIKEFVHVKVPFTDDNIVSYSSVNDIVSSYFGNTHYNASDYTVSDVEGYAQTSTNYIKDWPQNITLSWMLNTKATGQRVIVSESPTFDEIVFSKIVDDATSSYRIEDMYMKKITPQKTYYYKITANLYGQNIALVSSAFKSTGTVRMIKTQKGCNIRDFGGWTGMNGHKVKYGVLYRGARIRANKAQGGKLMITSDDVAKLLDLGILGEIDLRSDDETNASASALDRMSVEFIRISDAIDCQGAKVVCGDAYIRSLQTIINWMKFGGINSVYISSSLGADRTGTLAFLINGLLGVDEESLSKDYELSSFSSDKLDNVLRKRNEGDFPAMVSAIKSLNGTTLQQKIYKYFNEGIYGIANSASISKDDLNWFISTMLGCPVSEVESSGLTMVEERVAPKVQSKIYNLLGQEVQNPGPGIYIMNGKKYIIR